MRYTVFSEQERSAYPVCLLVPQIRKDDIKKAYIDSSGLNPDDLLVMDLHQAQGKKKTPMAVMRAYIEEELVPVFQDMDIKYILCADSEYFKALTKATKVDANLGYVLDSDYGPKVIYVPNYRAIFYDPEKIKSKIDQGMQALLAHMSGQYAAPGNDVIKFAEYPQTDAEIEAWLLKLLNMNTPLAIDIEGFSLKHYDCGIASICMSWNKHEGIAFPVDYVPIEGATEAPFGKQVRNEPRRKMLRRFFELLSQKAIYHSISFDVTVLIYQLYMEHILDTKGLLHGMNIMLKNWDCTKLITYLATNSCAGNDLSLKTQAQEYCGNYAMGEDIKDITRIPLPKLLEYNLIDGMGTWYTHEKHYDQMVNDDQLHIYETLFKPSTVDIIQMQLTGMPVNMQEVKRVEKKLNDEIDEAVSSILAHPIIKQFTKEVLDVDHTNKRNEKLKVKQINVGDEPQTFNPNSDPQMRKLLFDYLELDVINLTKSKIPSTDGETIEALLNRVTDESILELLGHFQQHAIISILTTNFIPALLESKEGPDGWHYLFGNFNLGGTLSGRLSSSGPNLQNLPSSAKGNPKKIKYAKMIKGCFQAPPGWLFCGLDFSSLEDRISALTTKDPNKLKVYTDGYDGHSLRAYAYFPEQMPDIDPNSIESINSIQKKYKPLRDKSKNPTFTLTYQGTFIALVKKYGFTEEQAKLVEARYHELYKVSDDWVNAKLDEAMVNGYIVAAFGLRVRTPLLKQVIRGNSKTPYEAEAEGRTAGNALGQSWCLLNSRAGNEFNALVRESEFKYDIRPCAQIHDAQYHLIRDDIRAVEYANEHMVNAVKWQDHPEIAHDEVGLGGELSIFFPSWNDEIIIPNEATREEIFAVVQEATTK